MKIIYSLFILTVLSILSCLPSRMKEAIKKSPCQEIEEIGLSAKHLNGPTLDPEKMNRLTVKERQESSSQVARYTILSVASNYLWNGYAYQVFDANGMRAYPRAGDQNDYGLSVSPEIELKCMDRFEGQRMSVSIYPCIHRDYLNVMPKKGVFEFNYGLICFKDQKAIKNVSFLAPSFVKKLSVSDKSKAKQALCQLVSDDENMIRLASDIKEFSKKAHDRIKLGELRCNCKMAALCKNIETTASIKSIDLQALSLQKSEEVSSILLEEETSEFISEQTDQIDFASGTNQSDPFTIENDGRNIDDLAIENKQINEELNKETKAVYTSTAAIAFMAGGLVFANILRTKDAFRNRKVAHNLILDAENEVNLKYMELQNANKNVTDPQKVIINVYRYYEDLLKIEKNLDVQSKNANFKDRATQSYFKQFKKGLEAKRIQFDGTQLVLGNYNKLDPRKRLNTHAITDLSQVNVKIRNTFGNRIKGLTKRPPSLSRSYALIGLAIVTGTLAASGSSSLNLTAMDSQTDLGAPIIKKTIEEAAYIGFQIKSVKQSSEEARRVLNELNQS